MNLMKSGGQPVAHEFANSAEQGGLAGVHISLRPWDGPCLEVVRGVAPTNLFLPLEQAAKLLLQLQYSLRHAYDEAPAEAKRTVEHIAAHEDSMTMGMAALGHPGGKTDTLEFLVGRR